MKLLPAIVIIAASSGTAVAQDGLNARRGVGYGKSYRDASDVYVARTPYTLEWSAAKTYQPDKKDPSWKVKDSESCVHVYDAKTGKIIASSNWGPLQGSIKVPQGGRHRVRVYSLGTWRANIIEDVEMLKKAQREGYLTPETVLTKEVRANSIVGKREAVAAAMAKDVKKLESERDKIPANDPQRLTKVNALDDKIAKVKLAASRASSEDDYQTRKRALLSPVR